MKKLQLNLTFPLLIALFHSTAIPYASAKRTLNIKFDTFANPTGETWNGGICLGNGLCQTYFSVCMEYMDCASHDIRQCSNSLLVDNKGAYQNFAVFRDFHVARDVEFQKAEGIRLKVVASLYNWGTIDLYTMDFPLTEDPSEPKQAVLCGTRSTITYAASTEIKLHYHWSDDGEMLNCGAPDCHKNPLAQKLIVPKLKNFVQLPNGLKDTRFCSNENNIRCRNGGVCLEKVNKVKKNQNVERKCHCPKGFEGKFCENKVVSKNSCLF